MRFQILVLTSMLLGGAAMAQDAPDVTEDGLVRVPSSVKAGVYRMPAASFQQYRRVIFGTITVTFKKGWEKNHPEVNADEKKVLRADLARTFRTELVKELVDRGGYQVADKPAPDVLRVEAQVEKVDIIAPKASAGHMQRTLIRTAGSMKVTVELKDAVSGVSVGRVISFERAPEYDEPQLASQISNLADFRLGFENSARYTHEAISVAKSAKREDQSQIKSEN